MNIIEQMQNEITKLNKKLFTLKLSKSNINYRFKKIQFQQKINEVKYELEIKLKLIDKEVQEY